ncbi:hypothetical protein SPRG_16187 [Saprolegnia parasitica CBS 223.65]|uniref:Uncharacterized protein n=1 Tax=Saprolegnia parasitica (strain CBS 223.65) TaxID=695850 RepID=A0A067BJT1_SAPPC|nr:hypothetical protein SPRG_16187 [Saprolegnia parasitica CBS 223.65]KDO18448.1 hypothetical protein SPRG_16187 [Saprolegnia parasitica CBS 223.65]|eukprot:XP_012210841.1 hypothetical protein SPRG_16187 [Saprolegnia parasitica CBS 223.65]
MSFQAAINANVSSLLYDVSPSLSMSISSVLLEPQTAFATTSLNSMTPFASLPTISFGATSVVTLQLSLWGFSVGSVPNVALATPVATIAASVQALLGGMGQLILTFASSHSEANKIMPQPQKGAGSNKNVAKGKGKDTDSGKGGNHTGSSGGKGAQGGR